MPWQELCVCVCQNSCYKKKSKHETPRPNTKRSVTLFHQMAM